VAGSTLRLEVVDNGHGITGSRRDGVGMSSMRERAEELDGTLSIEPAPGTGTRLVAELPLTHTDE
jgi:signal transduction histidine kinase